ELKGVDELVTDDVVRITQRTAERQHDPTAQRFGDAARPLAQLALNRVGLLEIRMRRVEDERLASMQLMREHTLESRQPAFRHASSDVDPFTFFRIEVD